MREVLRDLFGDAILLDELDVEELVVPISAHQLDPLRHARTRALRHPRLARDHFVDQLLRHCAVRRPLATADECDARAGVGADGVVARNGRTGRRLRVPVQRAPPLPRGEHIGATDAQVAREARCASLTRYCISSSDTWGELVASDFLSVEPTTVCPCHGKKYMVAPRLVRRFAKPIPPGVK